MQGFAPQELAGVPPESFDLLYLYSRRWEPPGNWVERYPAWLRMQGRYFDYQPQAAAQAVVTRYHLRLVGKNGTPRPVGANLLALRFPPKAHFRANRTRPGLRASHNFAKPSEISPGRARTRTSPPTEFLVDRLRR